MVDTITIIMVEVARPNQQAFPFYRYSKFPLTKPFSEKYLKLIGKNDIEDALKIEWLLRNT
jgi:hypothetical protein